MKERHMMTRHVGLLMVAVIGTGLSAAAQDATPTLEDALQNLPGYSMGDDGRGLEMIRAEVNRVHGDAPAREALERGLLAVLEGESTGDAKRFVCRQLYVMGSARAVPTLSALLANPDTADEARYALERMQNPEAGAALRAALDQLDGHDRVGVVASLAVRREEQAVPGLLALLAGEDTEAAAAAADALGQIGGGAACDALRAYCNDERDPVRAAIHNGLLACTERMLAQGDRAAAAEVYEQLYNSQARAAVHVAAFRGMVMARPDDALALIQAAAAADDAPVFLAALGFVRSAAPERTRDFANLLPGLPAERKTAFVKALADRGDPAALPTVMDAARQVEAPVRVEALRALARLGDRTAIPLLARAAASGSGDESDAAHVSLRRLRGDDINRVMMTAARAGDEDVGRVLIVALGERQASEVTPDLLRMAATGKEALREDALQALARLAGPADLEALVALLVDARQENVQRAAAQAVVATAARAEFDDGKTAALRDALASAGDPATRAALVGVLGKIGAAPGLEAIRTALQDADGGVRRAAVKALSEWPQEDVMSDLAHLARHADDPAARDAAFEGYIRLIRQDTGRDPQESVRLYSQALEWVSGPAQLRMLFAGLAEAPDPAALELVLPFLTHPDISAEARIAYDRIRRGLYVVTASHKPETARRVLDGDPRSRWDTGTTQTPGQWFQIDLTEPARIQGIVLDTTRSRDDYPRGYEVYLALEQDNWGAPVAAGEGAGPVTRIEIPDVEAQYIKIVQTGSAGGNFWSIHELEVQTK
jgi:HEAT repeat protein